MADFQPPSFSLGFDFDCDSVAVRDDLSEKQAQQGSAIPSFCLIEEDDDFEPPLEEEDLRAQPSSSSQTLKRIRRGLNPESTPLPPPKRPALDLSCNFDDDIEDFSSQEDPPKADEPPAMQHHSVCSSSKLSLRGFQTAQSVSQSKARKMQEIKPQASANMEMNNKKLAFPELTVSPLRRFQLLDSDSDDPSVSEDAVGGSNKVDSSLKKRQLVPGQSLTGSEQKGTKASFSLYKTDDLWKDFRSENSFHIPTPALDEVCEEYFTSLNKKNENQRLRSDVHSSKSQCFYQSSNVNKIDERQWDSDSGCPFPPSHRYFNNEDPRIRKLVCSRLPNFCPLGALDSKENKQPSGSNIDYMGQFGHGEGPKQPTPRNTNANTSSSKGRKNTKKSKGVGVSQGDGGWMNPKECEAIPKDAGKRRIQAVGQSAGHWYTGSDGRKVYVAKNGQELSGRNAYRHYKKESGGGFKKSKKKTVTRKKNTGKKK